MSDRLAKFLVGLVFFGGCAAFITLVVIGFATLAGEHPLAALVVILGAIVVGLSLAFALDENA